jgi:hypothetical protein
MRHTVPFVALLLSLVNVSHIQAGPDHGAICNHLPCPTSSFYEPDFSVQRIWERSCRRPESKPFCPVPRCVVDNCPTS